MDELRGIFPTRYIPILLRNNFVAEEVVNHRQQLVGRYDPTQFHDVAVRYPDRALGKDVVIAFHNGEIWKFEA